MHYEGWIDTDKSNSLENGFSIGGWRVRPHSGELHAPRRLSLSFWRTQATVRHVEPKAMRVLLVLAGRSGNFVSKNELIGQAWDGRPVTDDVLTRAIHSLRAALDDDARDPRFIETRSNVGYRLLLAVKSDSSRHHVGLLRPAIIIATGLLIAVAITAFLDRDHRQPFGSMTTVAVLPFMHLAESASEDYLAAAMTEALILNLAQLPDIRVISRTSVMAVGQQAGSAESIARRLGADLLVEGSVQTENGQARVVAQLIDPFQNGHLWAQHFDRKTDDILTLQQDVSAAIARQIGYVVTEALPVSDLLPSSAMQDFLQARYLLAQNQLDSVESAVAIFSDLSHRYPAFAPAHLGIAQSLLFLFKKQVRDFGALEQGLAAADVYEGLVGATSESHRCVAQLLLFSNWDFDAAEIRYQMAISLNPSDTIARRRYAWLLVARQEYDRAAAEIHQIRLLDPLYYDSAEMAALMLYSGQVDTAVEELERLDETSDLGKVALRLMGTAYLAAGRDQEARQSFIRMLEVANKGMPGQDTRLEEVTSTQLYRHIIKVKPFTSSIASAGFHNLLGNTSAAMAELELAVQQRDPHVLYLGALPELASLHSQPQFMALLETIGVLPENLDHLRETRLVSANLSNPQTKPHEK